MTTNTQIGHSSALLSTSPYPPSLLPSTNDLEHAVTIFETSIRQAAASSIPSQTVKKNHLTHPPTLRVLLKLKNHYRRRYQRSRLHIHHHVHTLFSLAFSAQLAQLRNTKWTSFLRTLQPQSSQFWKNTRYFGTPTPSVPPLTYLGSQIYQPPSSRDTDPTVREIPPSHPKYGLRHSLLNSYLSCQQILPQYILQTPLQKLTNHYEVRHKILSLKSRAAPGDDGITSIMLRHL